MWAKCTFCGEGHDARDNSVTLCATCHNMFLTHGEEFVEWMNRVIEYRVDKAIEHHISAYEHNFNDRW